MKFEALILRVLCAGSLLFCVLAFGDMLLTAPQPAPAASALASTTQCTAAAHVLPGQAADGQRDRG